MTSQKEAMSPVTTSSQAVSSAAAPGHRPLGVPDPWSVWREPCCDGGPQGSSPSPQAQLHTVTSFLLAVRRCWGR